MPLLTDPIGDLITRIRNAQSAARASCRAPYSRIKHELLSLLVKKGWFQSVEVSGEGKEKTLEVFFKADKMNLEVKRISKPSRRVYRASADLKPILRGFGAAVLTTSQGLLTDADARKAGIGGEILCTVC